jgi:hypothetical protein
MTKPTIFAIALATLLAACASAAPDYEPNSAERAAMAAAPKPSSPEAAQAAVKAFFAQRLIDPTAPLYRFPLPPTLAVISIGRSHFAGWLICGEINSKNRMGGYTGFDQFIAQFSPTTPDLVIDGLVGDDDIGRNLVSGQCREAYRGAG